jgi:hypothetical protein
MMRVAALSFLLIVSFASIAHAQDGQSPSQPQLLGDVARQARAAKSSTPKSAVVLDDDNMPKSKNGAANGGKLSADKQAYCDELRQRKQPDAEQSCAALAIDMGPEYEDVFGRYVELAKSVCASNGGRLPTSEPKDPALSAQWHELINAGGKFNELMKPETKSLIDAEKATEDIRQEETRELDKSVPDWRNAAVLATNPREKQRYNEIDAEYKARIAAHENGAVNEKARWQRFIVDTMRLQQVCNQH